MSDVTFDHGTSFEQGEISGNLRLGRFEAQYEELFAEVIEDGIITAEERARLDRAAQAMGLEPLRLRRLEDALEAAYEARHRVKIRRDDLDEPAPASIAPLAPATDPRVQALERRIAQLQARVVELEKELEAAHELASLEVDISDVAAVRHAQDDDPDELLRALRTNPRDPATLHALYRVWTTRGERDRALTTAEVLVHLDHATSDERAFFDTHEPKGLIQPTTSLTQEGWRRSLFHPDEEILTGEIFAVVTSAVLLGRVSALRRDKQLLVMDPGKRHDPKTSTVQAVRCFSWGAAILGLPCPQLFADPDFLGGAEMVAGLPPVTRLGKLALSGRSANELAFLAGAHLAWYREEHFVRVLIPSIVDLEDVFLSALLIGNPGIPLTPEVRRRVEPIARAIEPILEPQVIDRLRGSFLRFVEQGGRTNLQRWATAADKTSFRAGHLLSGRLDVSLRMVDLLAKDRAAEITEDLLAFTTSDRHAALRRQLGVALA